MARLNPLDNRSVYWYPAVRAARLPGSHERVYVYADGSIKLANEAYMKLYLLLLSLACCTPAIAADNDAAALMKRIEGVYKHRFMSATITPGKAPMEADVPYQAEDVIEIVRYDDSHIYLRADLNFYNGHTCNVSGLAGYETESFVFHDPEPGYPGGAQCALRVSTDKDKLFITDRSTPDGESSCRAYCGVRGSLSNTTMPLSARRPIRYMDLVKNSRQYKKAEADLKRYEAAESKASGG
jgi:hypothetical protein